MIDLSESTIPVQLKKQIHVCTLKEVPRIPKNITYDEFFTRFLRPNQPCIIEPDFTQHWKSREEWVQPNTGAPNFDFLKENFGSVKVPVADCNQQFFNSQNKCEQNLQQYLEYWENYCNIGYSKDLPCLYMKDWHFVRDFPKYKAYEWPALFASDWLNEYWSTKAGNDDYRFVYMGPKGSWTPLHVDVLTSFSWSSNICGRKRWLLFPPGSESSFRLPLGDFPFDESLSTGTSQAIEVEQTAGETIFVPSGWHHQVWNMEDTISVNHNWLNGCCVSQSWAGLQAELVAVRKELADCIDMDGWEHQCQVVLTATAGTNLQDFLQMLRCIANTRIRCLDGEHTIASANWSLGRQHARFDLQSILEILPQLAEEMGDQAKPALNLLSDIDKALSQ